MRSILEALREGDHSIVDAFVEANSVWKSLLRDIHDVSVETLAERLHLAQPKFEKIAGERHLGKILLGWSGYTHLYSCDVGFEDNLPKAEKLRKAFAQSFCSVEVKHASRAAADEYGVE